MDGSLSVEVEPWQRGILASGVLMTLLAVSASLYVQFTPLGTYSIHSIVGQYLGSSLFSPAMWMVGGAVSVVGSPTVLALILLPALTATVPHLCDQRAL